MGKTYGPKGWNIYYATILTRIFIKWCMTDTWCHRHFLECINSFQIYVGNVKNKEGIFYHHFMLKKKLKSNLD